MSDTLIDQVSSAGAVAENPFGILKRLADAVNQATVNDFDDPGVQKMILYALENREEFGELKVVVDGLLRSRGLYPYLDESALTERERLAYEAHRPPGMEDVVFHQKQAEVFSRLMAGENVVLSAPTSFGKSLIIDALVASDRYKNIAVIVPTIALIDETRRRLAAKFGEKFKVITHSSQSWEECNVFVLTQERLLDFEVLPALDLFVIDEFYKLDPRRDSDRALLLNQAFYRLLKTGAQFYMLGPNIEKVPDSFTRITKSEFVATNYSTVVTEHISVDVGGADGLDKLIALCKELHEPTLIYCASPASARRLAVALVAAGIKSGSQELSEASDWVGDNYHPEWVVARGLLHGVGVHHGKVPRSLGQYAVRAFNEGLLRFLVCTSTLIEGVNTKAKNVIIYDNRVATRKFDYFTFNNIRGRSGRMFEHFVGRVYLFNPPPQDDLPFVDVPLVNQDDSTAESLLIQLDDDDLTQRSRTRVADLKNSTLGLEVIKGNSGIDPRAQIALAEELWTGGGETFRKLAWVGFPEYEQLEFACELIWRHFVAGKRLGGEVYSASQLALKIDRLRKARSVKKLILRELASQNSPDADAAVEGVLDFVRTWAGFNFPRFLMALDRIQRAVYMQLIGRAGDYSAYAANVENMFSTSGLVALDEYGVPFQIAERIASLLEPHETVDQAVNSLRRLNVSGVRALSDFERKLISDAKVGLGRSRPKK